MVATLAVVTAIAAPGPSLQAQVGSLGSWVALGGSLERDLRRERLDGGERLADGWMMRTPSSLFAWADSAPDPVVSLLAPTVRGAWNSTLPSSYNDGALWAGRGVNAWVAGGVALQVGRLRLMVAPEVTYRANRPFQVIPFDPTEGERDPWAHPFHPLPESLDQPVRFGHESRAEVRPGQSTLAVDLGSLEVGVSTANAWWGPGIRNALVLSNQGEGVPRAFLGTRRPLETPLGSVEGRWIVGRLQESDFFDDDPSNDHRSLSGLILTLRPAFDPRLTLGFTRTVFAPMDEGGVPVGAAFDVLRNVGRPNSTEEPGTEAADQILGLFGSWLFPEADFEAHFEWVRFEQPRNPRDFLEFPQHSQGYTYGLQWAPSLGGDRYLSVEGEHTNLEPSGTWRQRYVFSSYTSRVVPQGYTHRGQVLGAAIGPGSSGQWIAVDYGSGDEWGVGVFGSRVRWDAAAHFRPVVTSPKREDLTLESGVRGHVERWGWRLAADLSRSMRINYLFQTFPADPGTGRAEGVDVANTSLGVTLSRALGR